MTDKTRVPFTTFDEMERFASQEHEKWASWMRHLFSNSERNLDGSVTIPTELVERWGRQCETKYQDLSESEKEWDRRVVRKYFKAVVDSMIMRYFDARYFAVIKDIEVKLTGWQQWAIKWFDLDFWARETQKRADHYKEQQEHFQSLYKQGLEREDDYKEMYYQARDSNDTWTASYQNRIHTLETENKQLWDRINEVPNLNEGKLDIFNSINNLMMSGRDPNLTQKLHHVVAYGIEKMMGRSDPDQEIPEGWEKYQEGGKCERT